MNDLGILILRLSFGLQMLLLHGLPKILNFSQYKSSFPDPLGVSSPISLGLAIFAEVVCAAFITVGFKTKLSAIPLAITMLVAIFGVHLHDAWKQKELAIVYLSVFVVLIITGSGKMSLDKFIRK